MRRKLFWFLLQVYCIGALAQKPGMINITEDDGLPSNTIYSLACDKKGYMWFGTDAGAIRYDGYEFISYSYAEGLSGSVVLDFFEDTIGRMWIKSYGKVPSYIYKGRAYGGRNTPGLAKMRTSTNSLCYFADGPNMWVTDFDASYLYAGSEVERFFYDNLESKEARSVSIFDLRNGRPVFSNKYGVLEWVDNKLEYIEKWPAGEVVSNLWYGGEMLLLREKGIYKYKDGKEELLLVFPTDFNENLRALRSDDRGGLWLLLHEGGIYHLKGELSDSISLRHYLEDSRVTEVAYDDFGNLWFSTLDEGVYLYPSASIYNITSLNDKVLGEVTSLSNYGDQLFIGNTEGELLVYDYLKKESKAYRMPCEVGATREVVAIKKLGNLILVGSGCGLVVIDKKKWRITDFFEKAGAMKTILVVDSIVHCAHASGIKSYSLNNGDSVLSAPGTAVLDLYLANTWHKGLLAATTLGVISIDVTGKAAPFGLEIGYLGERVNRVEGDSLGNLFFGTAYNGIVWLKEDTFSIIGEEDGLNGDYCRELVLENDTLWWASSTGFSKVLIDKENMKVKKICHLSSYNGLPSKSINDIALGKDTVWLATEKGISAIRRSNIFPSQARLSVDKVLFIGKDTVTSLNQKIIPYRQNNLHLKIGSIDFIHPDNTRVQYYASALGEGWITTNDRDIKLFGLQPRKYDLKVRLVSDGGEVISDEVNLEFEIASPIWMNGWFIFLCIILAILLVALLVWAVGARIRLVEQRKSAIRERMARSRLTALQAQMSPHFIFNSLGAIRDVIKNESPEVGVAYLTKFAKLVRSALQSSTNNWISISKEVELLGSYLDLERLRYDNRFDYTINVNKNVDSDLIVLPSMLLQPICENAIKHGIKNVTNGKLDITFEMVSDDCLEVSIIDNGVGVSKKKNEKPIETGHQSISLSNIVERLTVIQELEQYEVTMNVSDLSEEGGTGTKVIVMVHLN